jgi:hypothetical protein
MRWYLCLVEERIEWIHAVYLCCVLCWRSRQRNFGTLNSPCLVKKFKIREGLSWVWVAAAKSELTWLESLVKMWADQESVSAERSEVCRESIDQGASVCWWGRKLVHIDQKLVDVTDVGHCQRLTLCSYQYVWRCTKTHKYHWQLSLVTVWLNP